MASESQHKTRLSEWRENIGRRFGEDLEKRYQVFVSSTFRDLQDERQEVMKALLELDCIPSGMELFPAADETAWQLIQRVIQDCDYYVLIIGGRYGSLGPEGLSYTEMEYRYATEIGKPTVAFLHSDPGKIIAEKVELSAEGQKKLADFRELAKRKHCKYWDTAVDLGSVVSRSSIVLTRTRPAIGWVRADKLLAEDGATELVQMRKEIDRLEEELGKARTSAPSGTDNLAQGDQVIAINFAFRSFDGTRRWLSWTGTATVKWNEIFATVAPYLIDEAAEHQIEAAINSMIGRTQTPRLAREKELKDAELSDFSVHSEDFQTVKVQLRALGLITKSSKNRSVNDRGTYWTLTPYGDEQMTRLVAIKRDAA